MVSKSIQAIVFILSFTIVRPETSQTTNKIQIPKPQTGTIHFSFNVTNQQNAQSNNHNYLSGEQTSTQPNDSPLFNKVAELWKENVKIQQLQSQGSNFLSNNKWYLLLAGTAVSYGFLAYFVLTGNSYLSDSNLWSSWRQELPMDKLLAIPQQQFAEELLREIQRRYTDAASISDVVRPLATFLGKIEQEEEQILWYQSVYSWLSYAKLPKLVPVSQHRFSKIPERLQRIAYYKNAFKSWAAEYQMQQTERMWSRAPQKEYPDIDFMAQLLQVEMRLKALNYWLKQVQNHIPQSH